MSVDRLNGPRRALVERYWPMALRIAKRFAERRPWLREALRDAAVFGLVRAGLAVSSDEGVGFCRLARRCCERECIRAIRDARPMGYRNRGGSPRVVPLGGRDFPRSEEVRVGRVDDRDLVEALAGRLSTREREVVLRCHLDGVGDAEAGRIERRARTIIARTRKIAERKMVAQARWLGLDASILAA